MQATRLSNVLQVHSFLAILRTGTTVSGNQLEGTELEEGLKTYHYSTDDSTFEIALSLRKNHISPLGLGTAPETIQIILGDDAEWPDSQGQECMSNAAFIECNLKKKSFRALSSIVALPPLFLYSGIGYIALASNIHLFLKISGLALHFDPAGLRDFCNVGYPVNHRTLFKDVSLVPGGSMLTADPEGRVAVDRAWTFPEKDPLPDWDSYTDLQLDAFKQAVRQIDLSQSFLSLTAGLDTRAILAALVMNGIRLPAFTMCGALLSLDARTARGLSKAYEFNHRVIVLDESFYKNLPAYLLEACRLSGGLSSLEQAHEVYFYANTACTAAARLSGNLGNQIGRRGTERISMRNTESSFLRFEHMTGVRSSGDEAHWYINGLSPDGSLDYKFLLQQEVPFSSVGNYSIGTSFLIQQSPYASRQLFEITQRMPSQDGLEKDLSLLNMRIRDLKHRFLGETASLSFQVKMIKETGGYVASCPINWGWRARGGVSATGIFKGFLTFLDALTYSRGLTSGFPGKILKLMHISGLHEFIHHKEVLKSNLKNFLYDNLLSTAIEQSGLFDQAVLRKMLHEHYSSQVCHHKSLVLALDIALAHKIFKVVV